MQVITFEIVGSKLPSLNPRKQEEQDTMKEIEKIVEEEEHLEKEESQVREANRKEDSQEVMQISTWAIKECIIN